MASIIETWKHWHPTLFRSDLFIGLPRLVEAFHAHSADSHSVRFEDLLDGDLRHWAGMMDYLDIEFDPRSLTRFSELQLNGRMGDPTGVKRYSALSREPRDKWKHALGNPIRKEWCRRYLRFLGDERLALMGYDRAEIVKELDSQPTSVACLLPDLGRLLADLAKEPVRRQARRNGLGGPNVLLELSKAPLPACSCSRVDRPVRVRAKSGPDPPPARGGASARLASSPTTESGLAPAIAPGRGACRACATRVAAGHTCDRCGERRGSVQAPSWRGS